MRITLLLSLILFGKLCCWSQVSMTLQIPPTGVMLKSQLWNMVFTNSSTSKIVEINLVLTDAASGQVVLTGKTDFITLNNGTRLITYSDINVQYAYPSPIIDDHDPNGYLTIGTFNACYTVFDKGSTHEYQILEECTDVIVEPVSPPLLNMPCDGCYAESLAPIFTWLPPAPLNLFSNLSYEMKLVELLPGQASSEAIQLNTPVLLQNGIANPFLNYPASGSALDTTKTYAWQVIAKNNDQYAAQSEIWTFSFSAIPPDSLIDNGENYITYRNADVVKGIHVIHSDTINVKYRSFVNGNAIMEFFDENEEKIYTIGEHFTEGENFFVIPLPSSFEKNLVYSFRFRYANTVTTKMYFIQQ